MAKSTISTTGYPDKYRGLSPLERSVAELKDWKKQMDRSRNTPVIETDGISLQQNIIGGVNYNGAIIASSPDQFKGYIYLPSMEDRRIGTEDFFTKIFDLKLGVNFVLADFGSPGLTPTFSTNVYFTMVRAFLNDTTAVERFLSFKIGTLTYNTVDGGLSMDAQYLSVLNLFNTINDRSIDGGGNPDFTTNGDKLIESQKLDILTNGAVINFGVFYNLTGLSGTQINTINMNFLLSVFNINAGFRTNGVLATIT